MPRDLRLALALLALASPTTAQIAGNIARPVARVVRTLRAPVIDGRLAGLDWPTAIPPGSFAARLGGT